MTGQIGMRADGPVGVIVIDNPGKANSLTRAMLDQLRDAWGWLETTPELLVGIITGAGDRHFSAGADMAELSRPGTLVERQEPLRITSAQNSVTKPVIAAVNGVVTGVAVGLVADCDYVIATRSAAFQDTHVELGQVPGYAALKLSVLIPPMEASRLALFGSGARLTAERAHALGLVAEVVDSRDDLDRVADARGRRIAELSPETVRTALASMREVRERALETVLPGALDRAKRHWDHPDAREGPRALLERRAPNWAGSTREQIDSRGIKESNR